MGGLFVYPNSKGPRKASRGFGLYPALLNPLKTNKGPDITAKRGSNCHTWSTVESPAPTRGVLPGLTALARQLQKFQPRMRLCRRGLCMAQRGAESWVLVVKVGRFTQVAAGY